MKYSVFVAGAGVLASVACSRSQELGSEPSQSPPVARIKLSTVPPNFMGLGVGATLKLSVSAFDTAGAEVSLHAVPDWSSTNPSVGQVISDPTNAPAGAGIANMLRYGSFYTRVAVKDHGVMFADSVLVLPLEPVRPPN